MARPIRAEYEEAFYNESIILGMESAADWPLSGALLEKEWQVFLDILW